MRWRQTTLSVRALATLALTLQLVLYAIAVGPLAGWVTGGGLALLCLRYKGAKGRPLTGRVAGALDILVGAATWIVTLTMWGLGHVSDHLLLLLPLYALAGAWYLIGRPKDPTVSLLYAGAVGLLGIVLLGCVANPGPMEVSGGVLVALLILMAFGRAQIQDRSDQNAAVRWIGRGVLVSVIAFAFSAAYIVPLGNSDLEGDGSASAQRDRVVGLVGYTDRIRLGSMSSLKQDDRVALHAVVTTVDGATWKHEDGERPGELPPLLLAGSHLDGFDGVSFFRSGPDRFQDPIDATGLRRAVTQRISLAVQGERTLFALHEIRKASAGTEIVDGELRLKDTDRRAFEYRVESSILWPRARARLEGRAALHHDPRYRALPEGWLRSDLVDLAQEICLAPGASDYTRILMVERWLQREGGFAYSRSNTNGGEDPLRKFLFETRVGHCEFYASAMVVLLRALDIPARVTVGYRGGTYSATNRRYNVLQKNAHAWVEVPFEGVGWVDFDPTPSESRLDLTPEGGEDGADSGGFDGMASGPGGPAAAEDADDFPIAGILGALGGGAFFLLLRRWLRKRRGLTLPQLQAEAGATLSVHMRYWLRGRGGPFKKALTLRETLSGTPLDQADEKRLAATAVATLDRMRFAPNGESLRPAAEESFRALPGNRLKKGLWKR